jgi:HK97 family phage major capsid protein
MDVIDLKKKRGTLAQEARELMDKAEKTDKRQLTDDESAKVDRMLGEIENLGVSIAREERLLGIEKANAHPEPIKPNPADEDATRGGNGAPEVRALTYDKDGQPVEGRVIDPKKEFRTLGEQLQAVVDAARPGGRMDPRLDIRAASGANETVPSEGGFLVQKDFVPDLLRRTYETGEIMKRVRKIPIGANSNGLLMNALSDASRANGSRWGGIQAYWLAEAELKTPSKPTFRQVEMKLKKIAGLMYATDELLQDSTALEAIIREAFPEEINFKVEDSILNGTGAGQPLGIINSGALITIPKETGQDAGSVMAENIVAMWARMWSRSRRSAVWLANQEVEAKLMLMGMNLGAVGGVPLWMPPGGLSAAPYATLLGRPLIPVEYLGGAGTAADLMLVDLDQYLLIDKGPIQAAQSIHVRFIYDETTFRFVYRVDGMPLWNVAGTPYKGTSGVTYSPYVALGARA